MTSELEHEAKSAFLKKISHEIRTPMNGIIGLSRLALNTTLTNEQKDYVEKILDSSETLLGLINDLLDFSSFELGELNIEKVQFNLEKIITRAANICSLKAHNKGVEVAIEIDSDVPLSLIVDPLRLQQVLVYLSNYIIKNAESGNVLLSVKKSMASADDNRLQLDFCVADNGEVRYKAPQKLAKQEQQPDVELTMAKALVEAMGGNFSDLDFSKPLSRFQFSLVEEKAPHQAELIEKNALEHKRILVVDDNEMARNILSTMVKDKGALVDEAEDGHTALSKLRSQLGNQSPYDLIIMDWKMPNLNGLEAAKIILNDATIYPQPKILMVTAYDQTDVKEQAKEIGIHGYIEKPVCSSSLVKAALSCIIGKEDANWDNQSDFELGQVDLSGAKILLAEDNKINRQVAIGFLRDTGVTIDIAENGAIALKRMEDEAYDLVLMDIQMPVMDGVTTTAKIRENQNLSDLPILAMTAHVLPVMKKQCLDVGMNDFISKPLDPEELLRKILLWLDLDKIEIRKKDNAPKSHMSGSDENRKVVELLYENTSLQVDTAVRRMQGKTELFLNLVKDFVKDHIDIEVNLTSLWQDQNLQDLSRYAHSLKSNAAYIGAMMVSKTAAELETAVNENAEIEAKMDVLIELTQNLITPINRCLSAIPNSSNGYTAFDAPTALGIVNRLIPLVESLDARSEDMVPALLQVCATSEFADETKEIAELLDDIEYDQALEALQKLAEKLR